MFCAHLPERSSQNTDLMVLPSCLKALKSSHHDNEVWCLEVAFPQPFEINGSVTLPASPSTSSCPRPPMCQNCSGSLPLVALYPLHEASHPGHDWLFTCLPPPPSCSQYPGYLCLPVLRYTGQMGKKVGMGKTNF